jgi:S-adenosylmethionine:diacylglycerol 3-amino-3-carboxypropyl transferase
MKFDNTNLEWIMEKDNRFLFNYGISQEDALTECKVLKLTGGDSLLCIASAGEIPLNIAALSDVRIIASDVSASQIRLCRLKQTAAINSDAVTAASFLGFMRMEESLREKFFRDEIMQYLSDDDREFWIKNIQTVKGGAINSGRFEKYMVKVTDIGRFIVGEKNLFSLFECRTVEEQKEVFDKHINGLIVNGLFRIAFHPWIYKNRGIDPAGLTHSGGRNIGEFFFLRFRNFCCNTLARKNYFLQYTFFNRILFPEALPEFLQPQYHDRFVKNIRNIEYTGISIEKILGDGESGKFNKIHISNIGDWMSEESMVNLFRLIRERTLPGTRVAMRYIHKNHKIPGFIPELVADYDLGEDLVLQDRYPFYSIVPIIRT